MLKVILYTESEVFVDVSVLRKGKDVAVSRKSVSSQQWLSEHVSVRVVACDCKWMRMVVSG